MKRPNIILLSIDEMSYSAFSCQGNIYARTPNMDRLFAMGVSFDRAYSSNPVCSPARASWATGLYGSENGSNLNFCSLLEKCEDIGQLIKKAGYYPAHAGKWHVENRNPRESFHCLYYGNDAIGAGGAEPFDAATTHAAISFLENYQEDTPFYLQIGYINPHDICEYQHNYECKEIPNLDNYHLVEDLPPLPPNYGIFPNETAVHKAFRRSENCLIHNDKWKILSKWSDAEWQYYIWNYYRFVERVDVEIGKLLTVLEHSPHRENTIILFTADHGEGLGEHSMFQKFTLYEESIHVPFVVLDLSGKWVSDKGRICHELVSGVDVFATICDYAQISYESSGESLKGFVDGRNDRRREYVYVENNYWGRAVVGSRYKLIMDYIPHMESSDYIPPKQTTHQIGDIQLFDLYLDPHETKDLSKELVLIVETMQRWLKKFEERIHTARIHPTAEALIDRCQKRVLEEYEKKSPAIYQESAR